jgi:hypothetical protein
MVLFIPLKPVVLVLSLLSGFVFLGFVGSSLLEGKEPFVTRGEARRMLVEQNASRVNSGHMHPLQVSSARAR